jgi:cysteine-S-conjugate beta-lyase
MNIDAITVEQLQKAGSLKWSMHPGKLGAFIAEMDFGTAPSIVAALEEAIRSERFGYQPPDLVRAMARACGDWYQTHYGWTVPAENIRPLGDVLNGLRMTVEHFTRPGSKVIIPTPAYLMFFKLVEFCGREIIEVPMIACTDGWKLDYEGIDQAFGDGGGLLIVCNPHNPIGKVYTRDEMNRVADIVERHSGRVFSDEIHSPVIFDDLQHVPYASLSPETAAHTITATSASKAWNLPGLKTAQVLLSNSADVAQWAEVGYFAEKGASNLGIVANIAGYETGAPWLEEVLEYLDGSRKLLADLIAEHLPAVNYVVPQATYLALLDCRSLDLGDKPADFFDEHAGVRLYDGSALGQAGKGFVRLNFATPRPILREIVTRMGKAVAQSS